MMANTITAGSPDRADDHPLEDTDSHAYQPVIDGEEGPLGDRGDEGAVMDMSHPPTRLPL